MSETTCVLGPCLRSSWNASDIHSTARHWRGGTQKARRTLREFVIEPGVSLGTQIKTLRGSAGLTLEALAEHSGISARAISDIERGVSTSPQRRTVLAVVDALKPDAATREKLLKTARDQRRSSGLVEDRSAAVAPHRTADFSGRDREISEILDTVPDSDHPISHVTLVSGPAGIGKTTVALEAVDRLQKQFSTRPLFVDLGGFSAAPLAALDVLRALLRQIPGIGEEVPTTIDDAVRRWQLETETSDYVVLLDNAAHESQVLPALTLNPRNRVVITSRRSLAELEGVRRLSLGPLAEEDAILMLGRLIPESQTGEGDLHELAGLCEHIPLALRIAGSRIASRPAASTGDFLVRMRATENRLRVLVAGDLAVEAAFALSYDELDSATAALFRSISVIDGPTFDGRIAAAIDGTHVLDNEERLDELIDLGLVEARGGSRYRVHDLLRLFGAAHHERASGLQGVADAHRRLRFWLLNSLERGGSWFEPERSPEIPNAIGTAFPDSATAEAWIRLEEPHWWPAMRQAADGGEHSTVVDVADALHWFSELWIEWGHWQEFFQLAVTSARALGDLRLEAMHLGYLVWAQVIETADHEVARETALVAVEVAGRSGDAQQRGWAHFYAAWTHSLVGRQAESADHCHVSIEQFGIAGDLEGTTQALSILTFVVNDRPGNELALVSFTAVLERLDRDKREKNVLVANLTRLAAYTGMARSYLAIGEHAQAIAAATLNVNLTAQLGSPIRSAGALRQRIRMYIAAGDVAAAEVDIATALTGLDSLPSASYPSWHRERLVALRDSLSAEN